jgi:hypothetical protein
VQKRTAWVHSTAEQSEEERRVSALVGERIVGGRYFDIGYPGRPPAYEGSFHVLDFGLELDLANDSTWSFVWQQAGNNEALLAYQGTLVGDQLIPEGEFAIWSIEEIPEWQPILGEPIEHVGSVWGRWGDDLCPVTWTIETGAGAFLCFTLGTRERDGSFRPSHDDVAVFFSHEEALRQAVPLPSAD